MTGLFSLTTRKSLAALLSVLFLAGVGSTASAIALTAAAQAQQDLRSPDARDAAVAQAAANPHNKRGPRPVDACIGTYTPGATPAVAYTSGATAGGACTPGTTAVHSATPRPLAGPPTWPKNPQPIGHARAVNAPTSKGGINWTTIGLGIVGSLLTITGLAAVARRNRRIQRTRVTA
jgi:hypothetical protein